MDTIITIILPLIGATVGYLLKWFLEKKRNLISEVAIQRRELYQKYVDLIIDILESSKKGIKGQETKHVNQIFQFYKKYVLYASPDVINAFSDYFQFLYKIQDSNNLNNNNTQFRLLSRIMMKMRADLGLSNKNLGKDGERLFRAILVDFDNMMK